MKKDTERNIKIKGKIINAFKKDKVKPDEAVSVLCDMLGHILMSAGCSKLEMLKAGEDGWVVTLGVREEEDEC